MAGEVEDGLGNAVAHFHYAPQPSRKPPFDGDQATLSLVQG